MDELIEATLGVALVHTPPAGELVNVVVAVVQMVVVPVIDATTGNGFTVTVTTGDIAETHVPLVTTAL